MPKNRVFCHFSGVFKAFLRLAVPSRCLNRKFCCIRQIFNLYVKNLTSALKITLLKHLIRRKRPDQVNQQLQPGTGIGFIV